MYFLESGSAKIQYHLFLSEKKMKGEHDFIILIHGLGMDSRYWYKIIPLLKEHFNVVFFDLRGHGYSTEGEEELSWDTLYNDILNLIKTLNLSTFHIIGHGVGANIAIQFTYYYPYLIKTLTIIASTVYFPPNSINDLITFRKDLIEKGSLDDLTSYLIPRILLNSTNNDSDAELLHSCYNKVSIHLYFEYFNLLNDVLSLEQISQMKTPTLILTGEFDPIFPPRLAGISTMAFNNYHYVVISDSSNMPFLEQPHVTSENIMNFISEDTDRTKRTDIVIEKHLDVLGNNLNQLIYSGVSELHDPILHIQLMNTFSVRMNENEIVKGWNQRNAKRLFCYLVMHKNVTREQIIDALINKEELGTAKRNLRVYLHHLKKLINCNNVEFLKTDNESTYFTGHIECDLIQYIDRINHLRNKDVHINYEEYLGVLTDAPKTILPGLYDEWALSLKKDIQQKLIHIAELLADYHIGKNQLVKAAKLLELVIDFEYVEEHLFIYLIDLYSKLNHTKKINYWTKEYSKNFD